jgi:molybdopterin converting factor small subunit
MKVTIEIFGSLRKHVPDYDPDRGVEVDLPVSATLNDLFARLNLPVTERNLVTVDRQMAEDDVELTDGASVCVFPFVGGG